MRPVHMALGEVFGDELHGWYLSVCVVGSFGVIPQEPVGEFSVKCVEVGKE